MPYDFKPIAYFAAGSVVGAAALAYVRKQLKPEGFPSLTQTLIDDEDVERFPKELQFVLRSMQRSMANPDLQVDPAAGSRPVRSNSMTSMPRQVSRKASDGKPGEHNIVRIALTGGPCAGKSSALLQIQAEGNSQGFDVYLAPETATLLFAAGFSFGGSPSPELKFSFQLAMQRLQLQLERSLTNLSTATGRPSIIVFDRGLLDSKGYNTADGWQKILDGLSAGDYKGVTEAYLLGRYDAVIHLVTAADGAEANYKHGWTVDDSGNKVFRRELPEEAREFDEKMKDVWKDHPRRVIIPNIKAGVPIDFQEKIREASAAVMSIANDKYPRQA